MVIRMTREIKILRFSGLVDLILCMMFPIVFLFGMIGLFFLKELDIIQQIVIVVAVFIGIIGTGIIIINIIDVLYCNGKLPSFRFKR